MADKDSTIIEKLDYLEETKSQIREALVNKGQTVSTTDSFRSYVDVINDIQIGTDTSDADATAYDIISPRVAYVKDKKITGKIDKINDKFSFDNFELSQTNKENDLIKDYTMKDNRIFHKEYLDGIDLIGKNFLIYMRPDSDESQAIVFTYSNANKLKISIDNNTITLKTCDINDNETNTLTTYTDLFLSGTPTKTNGSYTGTYFGNDSYYTTSNIVDKDNNIIFKASENIKYDYFTINQSFDETKAVSSEASNSVNIEQKTLAQIGGLKPEILKKDEEVMGIKGILESGIGDVQLFETEEEMQEKGTKNEGDLAVVYQSKISNCTLASQFSQATFPKTVIISEVIDDYIMMRFTSTDSSSWFDCMGEIDNQRFRMDCFGSSGEYRVEYTSEDGIHYTRTTLQDPNGDVSGDTLDFGLILQVRDRDAEYWDDRIGEFIKCLNSSFEGLFEYKLQNTNKKYLKFFDYNSYEITLGQNPVLVNLTYLPFTFNTEKVFNLVKKIIIEKDIWMNGIALTVGANGELQLSGGFQILDNDSYNYTSGGSTFYLDDEKNIIGLGNNGNNYWTTLLDIENQTYTDFSHNKLSVVPISTMIMITMDYNSDLPFEFRDQYFEYTYTGNYYTIYRPDDEKTFSPYSIEDMYALTSNQFTLSSSSQLLPGKIGFGSNGIITGDDSIYNNLDTTKVIELLLNKLKSTDYNKLRKWGTYYAESSLNTRKLNKLYYNDKKRENNAIYPLLGVEEPVTIFENSNAFTNFLKCNASTGEAIYYGKSGTNMYIGIINLSTLECKEVGMFTGLADYMLSYDTTSFNFYLDETNNRLYFNYCTAQLNWKLAYINLTNGQVTECYSTTRSKRYEYWDIIGIDEIRNTIYYKVYDSDASTTNILYTPLTSFSKNTVVTFNTRYVGAWSSKNYISYEASQGSDRNCHFCKKGTTTWTSRNSLFSTMQSGIIPTVELDNDCFYINQYGIADKDLNKIINYHSVFSYYKKETNDDGSITYYNELDGSTTIDYSKKTATSLSKMSSSFYDIIGSNSPKAIYFDGYFYNVIAVYNTTIRLFKMVPVRVTTEDYTKEGPLVIINNFELPNSAYIILNDFEYNTLKPKVSYKEVQNANNILDEVLKDM